MHEIISKLLSTCDIVSALEIKKSKWELAITFRQHYLDKFTHERWEEMERIIE